MDIRLTKSRQAGRGSVKLSQGLSRQGECKLFPHTCTCSIPRPCLTCLWFARAICAARGPKFIKQGKDVRYPIEYLDEWIDQFKQGDVPGWEPVEGNTTGLRNQKKSGAQVDAAYSDLTEIKDNGGQSHDRIP